MNLLILYTKDQNEIFNRKSAIGSYIFCLGEILSKSNVNVFLNGKHIDLVGGVSCENEKVSNRIKSKLKAIIPQFIKRWLRDKGHLNQLNEFKNRLLKDGNSYDAVLEFYNLGSDIGLSVSEGRDIPLYITYDGPIAEEYQFFNNGASPVFYKKIKKREMTSLVAAKKIVVYSEPMRSFIKGITNRTDNVFIHQNVDFTRFDVLSDPKDFIATTVNICFIGSFLKWHQVELFVESIKQCLEEGYDLKAYLIGDGMERGAIEKIVEGLEDRIRSRIVFTGFLDGKELFELKKKMQIGVMPGSNWYGAPNKIFEYGAMKMAVIAPRTPTIIDLFNEDEVVFFDWKNQESLFKSLQKILDSVDDRKLYSEILNQKVLKKYRPAETAKFYKALFQ